MKELNQTNKLFGLFEVTTTSDGNLEIYLITDDGEREQIDRVRYEQICRESKEYIITELKRIYEDHIIEEVTKMKQIKVSMKIKKLAIKLFSMAYKDGLVPLGDGVFLRSGEDLRAEQESWADDDPCKCMEFMGDMYITTDDDVSPIEVSIDDLCRPPLLSFLTKVMG